MEDETLPPEPSIPSAEVLRDKLRAAEINLSDLRDCVAQNEELTTRIAGVEALLCDAQAEISDLRTALVAKEQECILLGASLRKCEDLLRPPENICLVASNHINRKRGL